MQTRKTAICLVLVVALTLTMLFSACRQEVVDNTKRSLTLAVCEDQSATVSSLVDGFNTSQSDYTAEIAVYESNEMIGYLLSNGAIEPDMVVMDNINFVNLYSQSLQPLNRFEATAGFQVSIINSLKTVDGNLFGLPSSGSIYSQCYNTELFDAIRIDEDDYPQSLSGYNGNLGMLEIADRMSVYNASSGNISYCNAMGDLSMVYMLMEVAVPMFASSTAGIDFVKNYYQDNVNIADSNYRNQWENVLTVYKTLFDCNYYSTDSQFVDTSDAVNKFVSGQAYVYAGAPEAVLEKTAEQGASLKQSDVLLYPFVGETLNQKWIISKPDFYLCVAKNQNDKATLAQSEGVEKFLSWFASPDGRRLSQSTKHSISYVSDMDTELFSSGNFKLLETSISQNKIYLSDEFIATFSVATNILKDYVGGKLTLNETILAIDKAVAAAAPGKELLYTAPNDLDFPASGQILQETAIGNMTADILCAQTSVEMAILPADTINCNLYAGQHTTRSLSVVFDSVAELAPVRMKVAGLKRILSDCSADGVFPLISGFRISASGEGTKLVKTGGIALSDDDTVLVLITRQWEQEYAQYIVKSSDGRYVSALDTIVNYLDAHERTFPNAVLDDRYGKYSLKTSD